MIQIAAVMVNVAAEAPALAQGDTEARPKPAPSAIRTNDSAAAAKAPPKIAGQATPEVAVSGGTARPSVSTPVAPLMEVSGMALLRSDQRQISARTMMIGIGTPKSQSRIPRPMFSSFCYSR
jgi:hypothetical protein